MDARFYNSDAIDIQRLANDLENMYRARGFQAQQFGSQDQILVQLKKGGDFESLIGMQAALSVTLQRTTGGVLAMIGQQRWLDKAAVGAVGIFAAPILWPLAITAGVGAVRQASLSNEVLNFVDGLARQQQPGVQPGPVPVQLMPQVQQQWAQPPHTSSSYVPPYVPPTPTPSSRSYVPPYVPPTPAAPPSQTTFSQAAPTPAPTMLRCPKCNTPYEAGDTFCSGCGRSLTEPKVRCSNCQTELKSDASFCPKCGTSTFQGRPSKTGAPAAPTIPTYTPPASSPARSVPPPPPRPVVQPYATSAPKEPPVVPKPTVTFIPATPNQDLASAPTLQQSAEPTVPVYTPPAVPAYTPPPAPTVIAKAQVPPPKSIVARPASEPAQSATDVWGLLLFGDGKEYELKGERVVLGRYDHDLGGLRPEIDLGSMEGADTASRVHAMLEHIGSAYTLTDLNSTNATRINGKRLEPDTATPISEGDTLRFGKISCTFKLA